MYMILKIKVIVIVNVFFLIEVDGIDYPPENVGKTETTPHHFTSEYIVRIK